MIKKLTKLVGLKKNDFDAFVQSGNIHLSPARLIPVLKVGDEMALTSIILSSLRLIKEFRDVFFSETQISRAGRIYYFTEAVFKDIDSESRIDGLIIVVVGGVIKDAAILEMKNKNNSVDAPQLQRYISLASKLKIKKIITISNQFVAHPSLSPVNVRVPKSISLLHFSWTYLQTIAHLLLFKNDTNIIDEDQIELMKEVLFYLENKVSGVVGYSQMKSGWNTVVENINSQKKLKMSDAFVEEAVVSWEEEERDMALMLSRELGVMVKSSIARNKAQLKDKLKRDIKSLVTKHKLESSLMIRGSVSDVGVIAEFDTRTIIMSVRTQPPLDRGVKARIGWIIRQIENFEKKNPELFNQISKELWIEGDVKFSSNNIRIKYSNIESLYDYTDKDIYAFNILYIKDLGKGFSSPRKFVEKIEKMLLDYYQCVVQYLTKWSPPPPKIESKKTESVQDKDVN
tara:strand:- start:401 stop:1771 length:1371 start_codon:yes stop_codon:yes gene_type:complete